MISSKPTALFVQSCPICAAAGTRIPYMLVLDCTCTVCGWHYTSTLKRSVLAALSRPAGRP